MKEVNFYKNRNNLICTGDSIYRELTEHYNDTSVLIQRRVTETLDDIFPNGTEFDLIKLDTQGSEIDIIKGGQILCKKSKLILMEVSIEKYNQDSPLYDEVIAFMHSINFEKIDELEDHFLNGKLIQKDILFINKSL